MEKPETEKKQVVQREMVGVGCPPGGWRENSPQLRILPLDQQARMEHSQGRCPVSAILPTDHNLGLPRKMGPNSVSSWRQNY